MSRDSIGEQGGLNVYGFCDNASVMDFDLLGLFGIPDLSHSWMWPAVPTPPFAELLVLLYAQSPLSADPWGPRFLRHYFFGDGTPIVLTRSELESIPSALPIINVWNSEDAFQALLLAKQTHNNQRVNTSRIENMTISGGIGNLTLGTFSLFLSGEIKCPREKWVFEGTFHLYDKFDFDPALRDFLNGNSGRSLGGELRTLLMYLMTSGRAFDVKSEMYPVRQAESDQEGEW